MARWVTRRGFRKTKEDLERLEKERRVGDTLSALLFAFGLLVIAIFTIHEIDRYFGDFARGPNAPDRSLWDQISDNADASSALFAFLKDLAQGWGLGLGLIGLSWLTARSLLRMTGDESYVTVGTGQPEAAANAVVESSTTSTPPGSTAST